MAERRRKLDRVAMWVSTSVANAFFASLERCYCINISTADSNEMDDEDEAKDVPLIARERRQSRKRRKNNKGGKFYLCRGSSHNDDDDGGDVGIMMSHHNGAYGTKELS